ncbi:TetR/AcrR family transcriptional regulator [Fodinicola acaciae]|uniref:TetR/AcrR family transcriptional regulator n=1 Tax=Fodinicola acaciae TaxID=2681555 RepID=UPI0013D2B066|nr:TetR family transcriptional regulator C-terminal domain-containing protein [Fodinicola acaciae]
MAGRVRGAQQERSRERREALLRAAIELIAEGGTRSVTHRAVSARAGLPPASAGYYFTTSQELIEQALRFHVREWSASLSAVIDGAAKSATSVRQFGERLVRALIAGEQGVSVAVYEVYLEAARNPALREVVQESMAAFEEVAAGHLSRLGARDPRGAAKSFVAIVDGFALHRLANPLPHEEHVEALLVTMSGMLLAHRLDRDELFRRIDEVR